MRQSLVRWLHVLLLLIALTTPSECTNKVIFVSFDGFRHDYLEMAAAKGRNISAFDHIRKQGFQAEVQNVMLTLTFPSHYAMATGRNVENHGLVGNKFFDERLNKSFKYKDPRRNMESDWFEYAGAEPLWQTNERHGHRSCVFQWIGSEARIRGKMAFATAGLYKEAYSLRWRVDRVLDHISKPEFNFCMFYFHEPDKSGHRYGPDSEEVLDAIELANDGIAYLLQRIEETPSLKGKINVVVSSDHGMTQVDPVNKVIDVYSKLKGLSYIGDTSAASIGLWPKKNTSIKQLHDAIMNTSHLSVYYKHEIPERYHFKNNRRIAPVFGIADNGYLVKSSSYKYSNLYGMHGYDNAEPDMHPFLVAFGPDVKKMEGIQRFYQIDLYPYICAMLGLDKPNKIDGRISRTLPFLVNRPSDEFLSQFKLYEMGVLVP
uniref:Ectonucleotide pyrophosphatase/phosphodiesterase family member 5-like n=1 Tax=Mesocestoides corti TaxID=53468 RepID=A0A5K3F465_MESCO